MSSPGVRLAFGAVSGLVAAAAMTSAMNRLHRRLPAPQRYPLSPREITERMAGGALAEADLRDVALAAHLAYGAVTGAVLGVPKRAPGLAAGAGYGVLVWAVSYFGWIPAARVLVPADRHPARRNALMIAVHLVWGAVTALTLREFDRAKAGMLAEGPLRDAPGPERA